jgi:hypothetical protein
LESQGRPEEALREYRAELDNYPENPGLRRRAEELEMKVRGAEAKQKIRTGAKGPASPQAR